MITLVKVFYLDSRRQTKKHSVLECQLVIYYLVILLSFYRNLLE